MVNLAVRTPPHGGGVVLPHPRPLPRGQIGASEGGASALGPRGSGVVGRGNSKRLRY